MQELSGVHLGAEEQRLVEVPSASDTRQEIVADAGADLAERVGVERGYDEDVGPLHKLEMQALLVEALRDLPLALVSEDLRHGRNLIYVNKVLCAFSQHDSYLKKSQLAIGRSNQNQ